MLSLIKNCVDVARFFVRPNACNSSQNKTSLDDTICKKEDESAPRKRDVHENHTTLQLSDSQGMSTSSVLEENEQDCFTDEIMQNK